jgi:nitrate reductase gamma subunit
MKAWFALAAVVLLLAASYVGAGPLHLEILFGVIVPYAAVALFLGGLIYRIVRWARSPVPFRITTTCGQQKSLDFIRSDNRENPHNKWGVVARMALEVLFFRSLFRNTRAEVRDDGRLVFGPAKWLWIAALAFHWSLLIVLVRHLRFFVEPASTFLAGLQAADGLFQVGVPVVYITSIVLLASVSWLLVRRLLVSQVRFLSLVGDYFPLFLIMAIATTGILMRHFYKVDVVAVKELAMGLVSFHPVVPAGIGAIFFVHLFLVSALFAYFPASKLVHAGGIFMSPTRNMVNNSRGVRHVNPWNYPVEVHTYQEYENEFRDVMREAGLPLERAE